MGWGDGRQRGGPFLNYSGIQRAPAVCKMRDRGKQQDIDLHLMEIEGTVKYDSLVALDHLRGYGVCFGKLPQSENGSRNSKSKNKNQSRIL